LRRDVSRDVRPELERMHGATVRASRLANQLLALAKAESSLDVPHELARVDLRTIASEAASDWVPQARARDIDLGFALERAEIDGDPLLLSELIDNLLDNAVRYTPRGGSVTVRSGCTDGAPFLSVEDNGPGIPVSERSRVLERFYRIPGTSGDGSGLGLAIVQEVVARHDGVLEIDAAGDHGGARFSVRFPGVRAVVV